MMRTHIKSSFVRSERKPRKQLAFYAAALSLAFGSVANAAATKCTIDADGTVAAEVDVDVSSCFDEHTKCSEWADMGECDTNPGYMFSQCRNSCNDCGRGDMGT